VFTPCVPVVPVALPAPTAPLLLSGVVVVPMVPVVDRGVVVVAPGFAVPSGMVPGAPVAEPRIPAVPVPVVLCGVTDPGVPAAPVPTAPVVPVWPAVEPGVTVVVAPVWPPMVPVVADPATPTPLWPAVAPVLAPAPVPAPPACAYAKQPDSSNVPVINNSFFVISRVTLREV
jgi:hypothetical protein